MNVDVDAARFYKLYPNLQNLHDFLDQAEVGRSIQGLNGTYIRVMGESISKNGCTTFYVSTERIVSSIATTIFKVRRCPDRSVEFKAFINERGVSNYELERLGHPKKWILYDRSVRTPPRLHPAHKRARSRSRSRSRSRHRRHRSRSGSTRRSGSANSR
jgi:hypothetical protein